MMLLLCAALVAASLAAIVSADDGSSRPITEYEAMPRLLISLLDEPYSAALSPDGELLATGQYDGAIIVWDVSSARPVKRLSGHADTVSALTFDSSSSRVISAGYDATVRVWDASTGEQLFVLAGPERRLTCVAISADGNRVVSGGYDSTVYLWRLDQPDAAPVVLADPEATVRTVAFSPDGLTVAAGDDTGTLHVWSATDARHVKSVAATEGPLRTIAISPDGRSIVTGSADGGMKSWNAATWEADASFRETWDAAIHSNPIVRATFNDDGRLLATADQQGEVRVHDLTSGETTSVLTAHRDEIVGLGFLPDAKALVTVSRDRTINVWRSKMPLSPRLATIECGDVRLWSLVVTPDDASLIAGGWHRFLCVWDLETGKRLRQIEGFEGTIDAVALTADGSHVACCGWKEEKIAVFDFQTGEKVAELTTGTRNRCVRFSPDDTTLAIGGEDGNLRFWDWRSATEPVTIRASAMPVYDVVYSPEGTQLVTCGGDWRKKEPGDVTFWRPDGSTWAEVTRLTEHTQAVRAVAFNHDGTRLASAGEGGLVIIWHAGTHVPLARLQHAGGVRPVAFSPRSDLIAVGAHDFTINVWDVARYEIVQRFQSEYNVFGLSYSGDGTALFSVSGKNRVEIWPTSESESMAERIRSWTQTVDR